MSSLTTNLKLVKPELQDNITPTIFADNFDKIDAALEGVSGGALSLEEIEASTNLDGKIPSAAALKEVNNSIGKLSNSLAKFMEAMGYDPNYTALIPIMTSNTSSFGEIIFSTERSGGNYYAYNAFDNNDNTCWMADGAIYPSYIGYKFNQAVCVKKIDCLFGNINGYYSTKFKFQASNDNSQWVNLLDETTRVDSNKHETYKVNNDKKYKYYRLYIISSNTSVASPFIHSLQMYSSNN